MRALSAEIGMTLAWDSLAGLRRAILAVHPHLGRVDEVAENAWQPIATRDMGQAEFRNAIKEFYLTNPVARASRLMGELAQGAAARAKTAIAAE